MSSTPTDPGTPGGASPGPGYGPYTAMGRDIARMPIPGNAEAAIWFLALIVGAIIVAISDTLTNRDWWFFFTVTTVAYLLSRGIAKASRVLEQ